MKNSMPIIIAGAAALLLLGGDKRKKGNKSRPGQPANQNCILIKSKDHYNEIMNKVKDSPHALFYYPDSYNITKLVNALCGKAAKKSPGPAIFAKASEVSKWSGKTVEPKIHMIGLGEHVGEAKMEDINMPWDDTFADALANA